MILVTNHGTGDTYMTLAFAKAYELVHGQEAAVCVKPEHAAISDMFPSATLWVGGIPDGSFNCHPTARHGIDISRFALLGRPTTHADLWRAMLDLPLEAPMARGQYDHGEMRPGRVVIIPQARSWPNSRPEFWGELYSRLDSEKWDVCMNNEIGGLSDLLHECSTAEWVIGPQCGVMAILCHAGFPCRKTFATPAVEDTGWIVPTTFPYASVQTFAGEDYDDVEEVKITEIPAVAIETILAGPHFNRTPVKHSLVTDIPVRMSPGDFCDRMSVLMLKMQRLRSKQVAAIYREYLRSFELFELLMDSHPEMLAPFAELQHVNRTAWDHNETAVPDALANRPMQDHHAAAIRLNKERVRLKNKINELCGSASTEIKSYYKDQP